ncbi:MAG: OadG family protein [Proteobacteria bacterium]|nr:OadG family protein [Pseudomonadota bacterium]
MQGTLMDQGLELMLFGMGTVLAFLSVLVLSITLMSWILARYFPVVEMPQGSGASPGRPPVGVLESPAEDARLIAVISAAIHRHRSKKSQ